MSESELTKVPALGLQDDDSTAADKVKVEEPSQDLDDEPINDLGPDEDINDAGESEIVKKQPDSQQQSDSEDNDIAAQQDDARASEEFEQRLGQKREQYDDEQDREQDPEQPQDQEIDQQDQQDQQDQEIDQQQDHDDYDEDDNIYSIKAHKRDNDTQTTKKKIIRKSKHSSATPDDAPDFVPLNHHASGYDSDGQSPVVDYSNEDPQSRKRRLLEEKMTSALKSQTTRRRKADEDDLERMQDDRIDALKNKMIEAANLDVEKNSQGEIATEKIKLLKEVTDVLSKADLAISILDNNLLEAVRLWLEPLPDASMPAYQIQKELIHALETLPIKTDHLVASGIGKVLVFYQRSTRTEPNLKKIVDRLIGDWTRPILNKSDSYKDRTIQFHEYNKNRYTNQLSSTKRHKPKEVKTLYEESAERRNRAAIPSARTTAYKIAPKVDPSLLKRQQGRAGQDERYRKLNQKMTLMNFKKKATRKGGPSIEGKNLAM